MRRHWASGEIDRQLYSTERIIIAEFDFPSTVLGFLSQRGGRDWSLLMKVRIPLPLFTSAALVTFFCVALPLFSGTPAATTTTLTITSGGSAVTTVVSGTVVTLTAAANSGASAISVGQVNFCDATVTYCTDIHLLGSAP